jgi:hypothetical protein
MKGMNLTTLMRQMYDAVHASDGRVAKSASRTLTGIAPVECEIFLSGMRRQKYEEKNRTYSLSGRTDCRLCWPDTSLVFRDRVAISPDSFPFFPYHMLLRPVRPESVKDSDFELIGQDLKHGLITPEHLDCRDGFTREDLATFGALVEEAPDYIITQSMRGSGASIPEHIHAHAFLKTQTRFPLLEKSCFRQLPQDGRIWVNDHVGYGLLVRGTADFIADVFVLMRAEFKLPSNHYIRMDEDFGGLIGLYVPRTRNLPSITRLATADWKFGAFEVVGLYDAKTADLYETLTSEEACRATSSVTVQDLGTRAAMELVCVRLSTVKISEGYV